jgi:hypothetical protein
LHMKKKQCEDGRADEVASATATMAAHSPERKQEAALALRGEKNGAARLSR